MLLGLKKKIAALLVFTMIIPSNVTFAAQAELIDDGILIENDADDNTLEIADGVYLFRGKSAEAEYEGAAGAEYKGAAETEYFKKRTIIVAVKKRLGTGEIVACDGAIVRVGDIKRTTDRFGYCSIPRPYNTKFVSVSKNDCYPYGTTVDADCDQNQEWILDEKGIRVKSVTIDGEEATDDKNPADIKFGSEKNSKIECDLEYDDVEFDYAELVASNKRQKFDSTTFELPLATDFNLDHDIYLDIHCKNGYIKRIELFYEKKSESEFINNMEGGGLSFGEGINMKIPDAVPFIGGGDLGADVSLPIKVNVCFEDAKWYAAIGVDLAHYEKETGEDAKKSTIKDIGKRFKELGSDTKEEASKRSLGLKNLKDAYKNVMENTPTKVGFDADLAVIGYMEGTYVDGRSKLMAGGFEFDASVEQTLTTQFSIGPVPVYVEEAFGAEIAAALNVAIADQFKGTVPRGKIDFNISLELGGGVGIKKIVSIGGGGRGELSGSWGIAAREGDTNSFELKGKISAYFKATLFIFTYKKTVAEKEWLLARYPNMDPAKGLTEFYENVDDNFSYELVDLSYLDDKSSSSGNIEIETVEDESAVGGEEQIKAYKIKDNIYRDAEVAYGVLEDGREVAVWLDSKDSDFNNLNIYYSLFDGSEWSEPVCVDPDGTPDNKFSIAISGNEILIAYQDAAKSYDTDGKITPDDTAEDIDISVAHIVSENDIKTHTFTTDGFDMCPVVTALDGQAAVLWVNDVTNSWFEDGNSNKIYVSELENGSWSEPKAAYEGLHSVNKLTAKYEGESLDIAYAEKTGETASGNAIYHVFENGNRVSSTDESEQNPQYFDNELYWYSDGVIHSAGISEAHEKIPTADYKLVKNANGEILAYFVDDNGYTSTVKYVYNCNDDNCWHSAVTHAALSTYVSDMDIIPQKDGRVKLLYVSQEVDENEMKAESDDQVGSPFKKASLVVSYDENGADMDIRDVHFRVGDIISEGEIPVHAEFVNTGIESIDNCKVEIIDDSGNVVASEKITDKLEPGKGVSVSVNSAEENIPENDRVYIRIVNENGDELDKYGEASEEKLMMSNEDIEVNDIIATQTEDGTELISGVITNYGHHERKDVAVALKKCHPKNDGIGDGGCEYDKEVVKSAVIPVLSASDSVVVSFEIDCEDNEVYEIAVDVVDDIEGDNRDFVVIDKSEIIDERKEIVSFNGTSYGVIFKPGISKSSGFVQQKGKNYILTKDMTKDGYTFTGWYNGTKKVSKLTEKYLQNNPNLVLVAGWKENTYKVKYVVKTPERGKKVIGKAKNLSKVRYSETITLPDNVSVDGYVLKGWKRSDSELLYLPGTKVEKLSGKTKKDKSITLIAVFEK